MDHVFYVPQAVKNLLSMSRLVSKGSIVVAKNTICPFKKYFSVNMNAIKWVNGITMFNLKAKSLFPEVHQTKRQTEIFQKNIMFKMKSLIREIGARRWTYHIQWI